MKGWGEPRGHTRGGLAAVPRRGGVGEMGGGGG